MKTVYIDLKKNYLSGDLHMGSYTYCHDYKRVIIRNVVQVIIEDNGTIRVDYRFRSRSRDICYRFFKVNEIEKLVVN